MNDGRSAALDEEPHELRRFWEALGDEIRVKLRLARGAKRVISSFRMTMSLYVSGRIVRMA
jgi:hypothetical protein